MRLARVSRLAIAAGALVCAMHAHGAPPLRVAIAYEAANVTPYTPGIPETLLELVYDKLAAPSPYLGNATPWLASAIVPEGTDGRTWRIQLRDGIRWHDGEPFTSADVVFTLRYYRDGIANRWTHHVSETPRLTTIEAIDRLSLRVACDVPCPLFDKVTAADLVILPEHVWKSVKRPNLYRGPLIGTGPYRVAELSPGRFLRLEANGDYFFGTPRVPSLVVSFIRNSATAFAALSAGEIDLVAAPVPPELVETLARRPGIGVVEEGDRLLTAVEMRVNSRRAPFSDPDIRRAVALAIDPREVLQRVALGHGVLGGFPAPASPWTKPGLHQPGGDPKQARSMLEAKGFRDRITLKVSTTEPLQQRAAEVVARQLKAVGLDVRVEVVDPGRVRALLGDQLFDLLIEDATPHALADPDQFMQAVLGGYLWRGGGSYPELDTMIRDWRTASTAEGRVQAGFALQQLHSAAPSTLILYYPRSQYAYRRAAYDGWRVVPGAGVFHKWSLLPPAQ